MMNTRFDFSKCNSYEDFEQLYNKFCDVVNGRFVDDKLGQYVSKRFNEREAIMLAKSNPQELRRIFESRERSLEGVLAQIYARSKEEQEQKGQEEKSQEEMAKDCTINECGEIIRPNNIVVQDFEIPEDSIKNDQEEQNTKVYEQQPEKQLQKRKDITAELWMNRFNGWYSAIDRVSQNVKAKFLEMKSDIVKAIKEKLKERTNHKQENIQNQDTDERW